MCSSARWCVCVGGSECLCMCVVVGGGGMWETMVSRACCCCCCCCCCWHVLRCVCAGRVGLTPHPTACPCQVIIFAATGVSQAQMDFPYAKKAIDAVQVNP